MAIAASAATAILLAACGEGGGPRILARGDDVDFVGEDHLGDQTMDILAEEQHGEVTGEARFNEVVLSFECADTETDGLVILGGEVTRSRADGTPAVGELIALLIWEGEPDRAVIWFNDESAPCGQFVESIIPEEAADDSAVVDVEASDDIETG